MEFVPAFYSPMHLALLMVPCKVFITLLIGVSMVETLFTPVYGTVH